MFLNISCDFVHRGNAQLAELTVQRTWLDSHKLSPTNRISAFRKFSFECMYGSTSLCNRNCKVCSVPVVKFTKPILTTADGVSPYQGQFSNSICPLLGLVSSPKDDNSLSLLLTTLSPTGKHKCTSLANTAYPAHSENMTSTKRIPNYLYQR